MDNISSINDSSDKEEISLSLDDIKKIWKIDFTEIKNSKDKLLGKLFDFNIYHFKKMLLIGFINSVSRSWYKIQSINDLHIFIDYFMDKQKGLTEKHITLYLTSRFNFKQLIRYFYFHEFMDKKIWSDNDKIDIKNITYQDEILLFDRFLETVTEESNITFITKYSHSKLILSSNLKNGYYLKIFYRPFKLNNRFKILPKDVPTDIDLILLNLDIMQTMDIMDNKHKIVETDIDILFNIASKDEIKSLMQDIVQSRPELETYIIKKISLVDMELTFDKMIKDGIFKAFENSLDILLKTIYERINNSEYDQSENMLDLNRKIVNKITKIFDSKII